MDEYIYDSNDPYLLGKQIAGKRKLLTGHVSVKKYGALVNARNLVTFLREPVSQTISHYRHHCRYNGFQGTLKDFCEESRFRNLQSRLLFGMDIEQVGFIGITERYDQFMDLFNGFYGTALKSYRLNAANKSSGSEFDQITLDMVRDQNKQDIALYRRAVQLLECRADLMEQGKPYTFGRVQTITDKQVAGWAYDSTNEPAWVEIYRNGALVNKVVSTQFKPALSAHNPPRASYVGFLHKFDQPLTSEDVVVCKVADTEQVLNGPQRLRQ